MLVIIKLAAVYKTQLVLYICSKTHLRWSEIATDFLIMLLLFGLYIRDFSLKVETGSTLDNHISIGNQIKQRDLHS